MPAQAARPVTVGLVLSCDDFIRRGTLLYPSLHRRCDHPPKVFGPGRGRSAASRQAGFLFHGPDKMRCGSSGLPDVFNGLVVRLGCSCALVSVGDEGGEARVAMQGGQELVVLDVKSLVGG